jgi:hypothetical protein
VSSVIIKGFGVGQRVIVKGFGGIAEVIIIKMVHAISIIRRTLSLVSK